MLSYDDVITNIKGMEIAQIKKQQIVDTARTESHSIVPARTVSPGYETAY